MTKAEIIFEKLAISGAAITKAVQNSMKRGKPISKIQKNLSGMEKSTIKGFTDKAGKVRSVSDPKYKQWADKGDAIDAAQKSL